MVKSILSLLYSRAALVCLLAVSGVSAQSIASRITWPVASAGVAVGLLVFFVAGIGVLIFIHVNARRNVVKDETEYALGVYDGECARRRLTAEERKALGELRRHLPEPLKPDVIFQSISLYERCLDTHIAGRLQAGMPRESMESEGELLRFLRQKMEYNILAPEHPLFSTRNIATGQKMSIFTVARGDAEGRQTSAMLAQNTKAVHVGEFYFTVRVFDELKDRLAAFSHSELTVAFVRQSDAAYSVNARVMGADAAAGTISFFHTLELSRSQKRAYMRLEVSSPMKFRVVAKADGGAPLDAQTRAARVSDISGGGLSFFADEPLKAGDTISVTVALPGESVTGVKSKVLAVAEVEGRTATRYRHHIQFIDIGERERERIIKYVFERQRHILQMR